jgi:GcrA cell cycle regulator
VTLLDAGIAGQPLRQSRRTHKDAWPEEKVERLAELVADGLSASQIAKQLGNTRNAVIGKVYRLGLRPERAESKPTQRKPRTLRTLRDQVFPPSTSPDIDLPPERADADIPQVFPPSTSPDIDLPPERADADIPLDQRRSLIELTDQTCRWPVGDQRDHDFFFCGAQKLAGSPYCLCHTRRARRP